jgi:hypothetical protein
MVCQRSMHQYSRVDDHDHHSPARLALSKIEARVKVVTALSSGSFMDEDLLPPVSKDVVSTLVSPFSLVCCFISFLLPFPLMCALLGIEPLVVCLPPLPEVAIIEEERKRKRNADCETLAERSRRVRENKEKGKAPQPIYAELGVSAFLLSDSGDVSSTAFGGDGVWCIGGRSVSLR